MAYPFDLIVALGSTQTGLTLTASVRDTAGSALGSQPAYTIVEQGGGWYSYHTSAMPDGQRGVVRILSGATVLAVGVVTPIETENADVKTSTRGTGTSTYAGGDTAGTTTLLSRLTSGRATLLDNMDAAITTRMATFTYTAAPTAAANLAAWLADADVVGLLSDALEARTNTAALVADTPEVAGPPAATSNLIERAGWLFKLARNKTVVTAAAIALRNDADTADDATAAHAEDAGTYTRDAWE